MLCEKLSEYNSELMVKNKELSALQEDNRLLAKQFRQKKEAEKKRLQFSQVRYHNNYLVNVLYMVIMQHYPYSLGTNK